MRPNGYKKNFLLPHECAAYSKSLHPQISAIEENRLQGQISDAEFVGLFLEKSIFYLFPKNWKSRRRSFEIEYQKSSPKTWSFLEYGYRGIPESAHRAIQKWMNNEYPLCLVNYVPSVAEVLDLQSQGQRCVTVLQQEKDLSEYVLGERDPFSFTIHDLIHADHFFQNEFQMHIQIGFSRLMKSLYDQIQLLESLKQNPLFASDFEYAASDMNSHGAHLCKYLKAILQKHQVMNQVKFPRLITSFFENLNTPLESTKTLQGLQDFLFQLSTNPEGLLE